MSRTRKREESRNPASKFIRLSGITGNFGYWDKVKETTIELTYPIVFLPLDILATVKGFHKTLEKNIYSNEVHNISTEILTVRAFDHGELTTGLYADTKDKIKSLGGKFAQSVYAMMYDENGDPELVNFQLVGASLSPFIDYQKEYKGKELYKYAVCITKSVTAKKGTNEYFVPIFESKEVSEETSAFADDLDVYLQKYLDKYKLGQLDSSKAQEVPDEEKEDFVIDETTQPIADKDEKEKLPF